MEPIESKSEQHQHQHQYHNVLVNVQDGVGTIMLNRPERGNAIDGPTGIEIVQAVHQLEDNNNVRVIVLAAAGRYFCSGLDLQASNQERLKESLANGHAAKSSLELFHAVQKCCKPTIARVQGPAFGGGVGLVCCCDIRVMDDQAFLCFAEAKRGIVPALISAFCVPAMGVSLARQYMLTASRLSAEDALHFGVVAAIAPQDLLDHTIGSYIVHLMESAPRAMAIIKETVAYVASHSHEKNLDYVQKVFARTVQSDEALYGVQCFMQKQRPDWSTFGIGASNKLESEHEQQQQEQQQEQDLPQAKL
jgi:methylglutaconyl-CoA hydratase